MKIRAINARVSLLAGALAVLAIPALAQDIFVRPNQQPSAPSPTGKPPTADLGLKQRMPTQQQPVVPPQAKPGQPAPIPAPTQAQPTAPAPTGTQGLPTYTLPAGSPTPPAGQNNSPFSTPMTSQRVGNAEIIKVDSSRDPVPVGSGGNVLTITAQPGLIGNNDKQVVGSALGLTPQEVQSNCFFRYDTIVTYGGNNGDYIPMKTSTSIRYNYPGNLNSVDVLPAIACRKLRAPVSGTVFEENNLYFVGLSTASCPATAGKSNGNVNLNFRYAGDGKIQCAF